MKKKLVTIMMAGLLAVSTCLTGFAANTNEDNDTNVFLAELDKAISESPILDNQKYDIKIRNNTARSSNGSLVLSDVDAIVDYLEQQELEQKNYQDSVVIINDGETSRATGDTTMTVKYTRSFVTKYELSAKVNVNKNTRVISRITSPRLTMSGGVGVSIENQSYNTEIIGNTVAFIECDYTLVTVIKIPGVTDLEIRRKEYRTWMNYEYDRVFDYGNEAV